MPSILIEPATREWTVAELRTLPTLERDAILSAAAELAHDDYTYDMEMTAFEAFDW